jgi:hypothetical protein
MVPPDLVKNSSLECRWGSDTYQTLLQPELRLRFPKENLAASRALFSMRLRVAMILEREDTVHMGGNEVFVFFTVHNGLFSDTISLTKDLMGEFPRNAIF